MAFVKKFVFYWIHRSTFLNNNVFLSMKVFLLFFLTNRADTGDIPQYFSLFANVPVYWYPE